MDYLWIFSNMDYLRFFAFELFVDYLKHGLFEIFRNLKHGSFVDCSKHGLFEIIYLWII